MSQHQLKYRFLHHSVNASLRLEEYYDRKGAIVASTPSEIPKKKSKIIRKSRTSLSNIMVAPISPDVKSVFVSYILQPLPTEAIAVSESPISQNTNNIEQQKEDILIVVPPKK